MALEHVGAALVMDSPKGCPVSNESTMIPEEAWADMSDGEEMLGSAKNWGFESAFPQHEPKTSRRAGESVDIVQALCFQRPRAFLLALEQDIISLLSAPSGARLRVPPVAPRYRELLEATCCRFRIQVIEEERAGRQELLLVATKDSRFALPAAAFVPTTWAGSCPLRWFRELPLKRQSPVTQGSKLTLPASPGLESFDVGLHFAASGDNSGGTGGEDEGSGPFEYPRGKQVHVLQPGSWELPKEWVWSRNEKGGAVLSVSVSHSSLKGSQGLGIALCADVDSSWAMLDRLLVASWTDAAQVYDGSDDEEQVEDPYVVVLKFDSSDSSWLCTFGRSWEVGAGRPQARFSVPCFNMKSTTFWVATYSTPGGSYLVEVGLGGFPQQRIFQTIAHRHVPRFCRFGIASLASPDKKGNAECEVSIDQAACPDVASRNHLVHLAAPSNKAPQIPQEGEHGVVALFPLGPRPNVWTSMFAVCLDTNSAQSFCRWASELGWNVSSFARAPLDGEPNDDGDVGHALELLSWLKEYRLFDSTLLASLGLLREPCAELAAVQAAACAVSVAKHKSQRKSQQNESGQQISPTFQAMLPMQYPGSFPNSPQRSRLGSSQAREFVPGAQAHASHDPFCMGYNSSTPAQAVSSAEMRVDVPVFMPRFPSEGAGKSELRVDVPEFFPGGIMVEADTTPPHHVPQRPSQAPSQQPQQRTTAVLDAAGLRTSPPGSPAVHGQRNKASPMAGTMCQVQPPMSPQTLQQRAPPIPLHQHLQQAQQPPSSPSPMGHSMMPRGSLQQTFLGRQVPMSPPLGPQRPQQHPSPQARLHQQVASPTHSQRWAQMQQQTRPHSPQHSPQSPQMQAPGRPSSQLCDHGMGAAGGSVFGGSAVASPTSAGHVDIGSRPPPYPAPFSGSVPFGGQIDEQHYPPPPPPHSAPGHLPAETPIYPSLVRSGDAYGKHLPPRHHMDGNRRDSGNGNHWLRGDPRRSEQEDGKKHKQSSDAEEWWAKNRRKSSGARVGKSNPTEQRMRKSITAPVSGYSKGENEWRDDDQEEAHRFQSSQVNQGDEDWQGSANGAKRGRNTRENDSLREEWRAVGKAGSWQKGRQENTWKRRGQQVHGEQYEGWQETEDVSARARANKSRGMIDSSGFHRIAIGHILGSESGGWQRKGGKGAYPAHAAGRSSR